MMETIIRYQIRYQIWLTTKYSALGYYPKTTKIASEEKTQGFHPPVRFRKNPSGSTCSATVFANAAFSGFSLPQ